jgi:hypothetical protein
LKKAFQRQSAWHRHHRLGQALQDQNTADYRQLTGNDLIRRPVVSYTRITPSRQLIKQITQSRTWSFFKGAKEPEPTEAVLMIGSERHVVQLRAGDMKQQKRLQQAITHFYKV